MSTVNKLNSHANQKEKTLGDIPFNPKIASTDRYEADSVDGQSIINLNFSVDMANKTGFKLHINGVGPLREGGVNDYIFTSIQADNTSSQVMLTQAILGIVNIVAINDKVVKEANPNLANLKSELNRRKVNANYILNGTFEYEDVTGWMLYNDGASAFPVDGIGGVVNSNVTFATSTVSALRGAKSAVLSKDAANRQGHGVSYDFQIDLADSNKNLMLKMDAKASSNYQAGYVTAYIYDKTNTQLISAVPAQISSQGVVLASFTSTDSLQYRLILHIASPDVTAWTLKIDSVEVGEPDLSLGYPGNDWNTNLAIVPNAAFGSVTGSTIESRRLGGELHVRGTFVMGIVTGGFAAIALPNGIKLDASRISNSAKGSYLGTFLSLDPGAGGAYIFSPSRGCVLFFDGTDTDNIYVSAQQAAAGVFQKATANVQWNDTCTASFEFSIPVVNYGANVQLANSKVEYAYNSNTADSDDLTSFAYGPLGQPIGAYTTAERTKRVRFPNALQQSDHVFVEVKENGNWIRLADHALNPAQQSAIHYGIRVVPVAGSTTDYDVKFGDGGATSSNATYATAGAVWSGFTGLNWRLVKSSNALAVEVQALPRSEVWLAGRPATASVNTAIFVWPRLVRNNGSDIVYTTSPTLGDALTVMQSGIYNIFIQISSSSSVQFGVSKNAAPGDLTNNILSIVSAAYDEITLLASQNSAEYGRGLSVDVWLEVGDIIRPHSNVGGSTNNDPSFFKMTRIR